MHVALVSGFWGQNIGNAFFNLGGKATLEAAGATVSLVQDQSAYWSFRDEAKGPYSRAWHFIESIEADLLVLQGPLLTRNFGNIWRSTLQHLAARGVPWAILSGGFRSYSADELRVAQSVLSEIPPLFISTRDEPTAKRLAEIFPAVRSGVDSGFFVRNSYDPPTIKADPYLALCFDHYVEPEIVADPKSDIRIRSIAYQMRYPLALDRLAGRSKAHAYIAQFLDRRQPPVALADGTEIVRPEHRTNPHLPFKIYQRPNSIASDEPWTYLALYANAEATISDRVHACVASLAYGRPAHLHNPNTKRKYLFESVGASNIEQTLAEVDPSRLEHEYGSVVGYLNGLLCAT